MASTSDVDVDTHKIIYFILEGCCGRALELTLVAVMSVESGAQRPLILRLINYPYAYILHKG